MRVALVLAAIVAVAAAESVPMLDVEEAATPLPTFAQDRTDEIDATMLVHQGQYEENGDGLYCCPAGSSCEVQHQNQQSKNYVAYSLNKTRADYLGDQPQTIVNDYNIGLSMEVVNGTCTAACPLQFPLQPFNLDGLNATLVNKTSTEETWTWKQTALGITMQTSYFDAKVDSDNKGTPVEQLDLLTPFGMAIGQQSTVWTSSVAGTPAASLFNVQGARGCPPPQNGCGNNNNVARAMMRIRENPQEFYYWHFNN